MKTIIPRTLPGTTDPAPQEYEMQSRALARRAAADGMVLLKNDGILPLAPGSRIALFGTGSVCAVKGGTGSGDVNARETVSIRDGLKNAGFVLMNEAWLDRCAADYAAARLVWKEEIWKKAESSADLSFIPAYFGTPFFAPPCPEIEPCSCDTAVYVLSRTAGEGKDRSVCGGDYLLSDSELHDLRTLCSCFENVVLAVNAGGAVDLSVLDELSGIRAVLAISQPGMELGNAFADILSGKVCPSGKLTASWPLHPQDHPCMQQENRSAVAAKSVPYNEDIYVGYRYFDTFGVPVRFSFGEGLSYTSFALSFVSVQQETGGFAVTVRAENTGCCSGRCVAQLYVTCPVDGMEKEYRRLAAFGKTQLLAAGSAEIMTLHFSAQLLSSFDEKAGATVLDPGFYHLWLGQSLAGAQHVGAISLSARTVLCENGRIWQDVQLPHRLSPGTERCRAVRFALDERIKRENLPVLCADAALLAAPCTDAHKASLKEAEEIAAKLTDEELVSVCIGRWQTPQTASLGSAGVSTPGSAGETTGIEALGVPSMVLADGPAGLRLTRTYYVEDGRPCVLSACDNFENGFLSRAQKEPAGTKYYQYCTAFPVGTAIAQSWDTALAEEFGRAVGLEMLRFHVSLWLAPGINIQRDPLCGRNFEYFSEDPLSAGVTAAAIAHGVQSVPGCGVTIKHFACNNQEDFRETSDSIVSERALREIYLKAFEIAVRSAQPMAIMTSYNLINGVHAANSSALCTRLARGEWGFDGLIMTDWLTTLYEPCTADGCIRAGNDLVMPGIEKDVISVRNALADGTLSHASLAACAARIIRIALSSCGVEDAKPYTENYQHLMQYLKTEHKETV